MATEFVSVKARTYEEARSQVPEHVLLSQVSFVRVPDPAEAELRRDKRIHARAFEDKRPVWEPGVRWWTFR